MKHKVITITSHTNILDENEKFIETEYPELNKYLDEGYYVSKTIPIVKPADTSYMYSITFVLESL